MRPEGWNIIIEDRKRGGLLYQYPDGSEYHMTKEEMRDSIWPNRAQDDNSDTKETN